MKSRIAVLNDNISMNKILQMAFSQDEFELLWFSDPPKFFEALSEARPSAVLFNLSCPAAGPDIGRRLCDHKETEQVPLIAIAEAFQQKEDGTQRPSSYSAFFRFPFDAVLLVEEVRRLVQGERPFPPLPEEPSGEGPPSTREAGEDDLERRMGRLAERIWEKRLAHLKSEIMTEVRKDISQGTLPGPDGEPGEG
jgi:DNA-binding response OmpR family regulator